MDILSNLKPAKGSHKKVKRIGRGEGSGHGGTATRGENGQRSRAGAKFRAWFEGGQMPLQRRVPKRGFHSPFRVEYQVINLSTLQKLVDDKKVTDGVINAVSLYKSGAISKAAAPFKILGNGELTAKLNVEAFKFSASAKEKIESVGGTTKEING
ncbi:MAG: 50S ribosomal protein L15 [Stygiobacter sp. RIFOXYC12_FULL_38_8]|nr:MAG: 50S ribosomal protein L15 [Stygiobacter sp.]KAF0215043.1 MAG: 50S ribosomal protein [Ignavibacteria bacterium]OGU63319.1 MAG: 50S ribosomal protein L15 [Stygiobacter sp. GWC2_38_9]OGU82125.1 MAG: 50S ribosomal protein L15 [Stygiobacter sp. RIFOXYA12_FULL_38_9]OGV08868.1 MAG: 50S ribosomal protein L15 [Stygiobacter sp. RIFOXYB2_FULL_37_11]OGV15533.1 MAG: 50S ribosomal protein L15 [Stygiobacter sp. RIFOXYC2_FULL_38_25]OGV16499.1 MAG: 50S ribosomal protein L15 [Stygiobacter sp. RIFOXYA2_